MSASPAEVRRSLTRLFGPDAAGFDGRRLAVARDGGRVEIAVGEMGERRLGVLALPSVRVRIVLSGLDKRAAAAFLADFDRAFQRGGG